MEVARSRKAGILYHDLNPQSMAELKVWMRIKIAKKVAVSSEGLDLVNKNFKDGVPTLKGKSVGPYLPVVTSNDIIKLHVELKMKV